MLRLPPHVRREIEGAAVGGYPKEACGLLIGRAKDAETQVERAVTARNLMVEQAGVRYDLDPDDFLAADEAARAEGMEIVGIWHSHPDHPARPSATDRAGAWKGWSYLIASVSGRCVEDLRSWRLDGEAFVEEDLAS